MIRTLITTALTLLSITVFASPAELVGTWISDCRVAREPGLFKVFVIEYKADGTGTNAFNYYSSPDCTGDSINFITSTNYTAYEDGRIVASIAITPDFTKTFEGTYKIINRDNLTLNGFDQDRAGAPVEIQCKRATVSPKPE